MNELPVDLWLTVHGLSGSGIWPPTNEEGVIRFCDFANSQCLLPLLMADDTLPAQILAMKPRYRVITAAHKRRSDQSLAAAVELTNALGSDRFLFYKGSDYRHRLYEKPEHRMMGDIDTYVPANAIDATLARLEALGYTRMFSKSLGSHSNGYHEKRIIVRGVMVELHRSFGQRIRAGIDYDAMWSRREPFGLDGATGYRLAPADAILCHAFNLCKDEFAPELNRYLDFYLLLMRYEQQLPTCVSLARAWGIERALFGALHITTALFAQLRTDMVNACMEQLLDRPTRRFLIERVLPDAKRELGGHRLRRRTQLWRKFMLMDRAWRRIAFVGYHWVTSASGLIARQRRQKKIPANP